jgi:hypothetical protein
MRWFVEVSRVGENSSDEKYCVEAKQWQAALQEARKLRGDSGPLSKFSIELLDDGYRAVDPKQKLRFVVAKAPLDAELSTESAVRPHLNGQVSVPPPAVTPAPVVMARSVGPLGSGTVGASVASAPLVTRPAVFSRPPVATPLAGATPLVGATPLASATPPGGVTPPVGVVTTERAVAAPPIVVPVPLVTPVALAPAAPLATASTDVALHAEPFAGVPSSALSPHAPDSAVHDISAPMGAGAEAPGPAYKSSGSAFPPRPGSSVRAPSVKPPAGITVPSDVIPPAPAVPKGLGPPVGLSQTFTQPSPVIDMPPPASVLRRREEEPTPESPITYREVAYVVDPGVSRGSVEALLWASFRDISRELADREGQKFVQLAIFDHKFERRPERAPLGTLAWKDWRGNPVVTFPLFDGTAPARASVPAPSIKPVPVVTISSSPPVAPPAAVAAATGASAAPAVATAPPPTVVAAAPATAPTAPTVVSEPAPVPVMIAAAPAAVSSPPAAPLAVALTPPSLATPETKSDAQAPIPLTREKTPSQPSAARSSQPSATRSSRPRMAAVRRRAGEDLIGELFETMHDLHFMRGVTDGAEFMMAAVDSIVPCDGVLIHVFDINTRQFVVVRAKGPGTMQALMHRTPDSEPFIHGVMRRPGSVAIHDVASDPRVLGPRWDALGVKPTRALCGPVRQGGRYLGLLELVNPLGEAPFHQTEQNAIDYVCEQFAEFLVNRPIVLDPDVILRR